MLWLFAEFLPETVAVIQEIKAKSNSKDFSIMSFLTVTAIVNIYTTNDIFMNACCITLAFVYCLENFLHRKKIEKLTQKYINYFATTEKVMFKPSRQVLSISYQQMFTQVPLIFNIDDTITLFYKLLFDETYFTIDGRRVNSEHITTFQRCFLTRIFQKTVQDDFNKKWRITVKVGGVFLPKIIIKIQPFRE